MQHLDAQVIEQACCWVQQGWTVWLCTVLSTYGSSPREPGALLIAREDGAHRGSLSGGCVEDDFLERLKLGDFSKPVQLVHYGNGSNNNRVHLPCGGKLEVLVEQLDPNTATLAHLKAVHVSLLGQHPLIRRVPWNGEEASLTQAETPAPTIQWRKEAVSIQIGPTRRLIIAGISPVSHACADFARTLGFEVIVCDPREELCHDFSIPGVEVKQVLPSNFISSGICHSVTAVVALTHDPRIDDLAMIEAVRTEAFYIGVMGSQQTSRQRGIRLGRSGGLTSQQIARIQMPVGLSLGSKTPAEIALAVMADIIRVYRGRPRYAL